MKIAFRNKDIIVFESALYRTTTTLVQFERSILLVDPNWLPLELETIERYINNNFPSHQLYLLFTHSDYDHILGYGLFKHATCIASKQFVHNSDTDNVLQQIIDFDLQFYIQRSYRPTYPDIDIIIETDGQKLTIDGVDCYFYQALGHTKDGLFMIIPEKVCWISGDYLSNIELPFIDHDYPSYVQTLDNANLLYSKFPELTILIPGHGDVGLERLEIKSRIDHDKLYLAMLPDHDTEVVQKELVDILNKYRDDHFMMAAHRANAEMVKR